MDDIDLKLVFFAIVIFVWIARGFYNVFVKPLQELTQKKRAEKASSWKGMIEELRRDLGHGEEGEPASQRMLEEEYVEGDSRAAKSAQALPPPIPQPQPRRPQTSQEESELLRARRAAREGLAAAATARSASAERRHAAPARPPSESARRKKPVAPPIEFLFEGDLEQAIVVQEVLGPPRCAQPLRPWRTAARATPRR